MSEAAKKDQAQFCPQCDNHCPVDALKCGRGRKFFGVADSGHEHNHDHCKHKDGLAGLLRQCGRFVKHTELNEDELFQALTDEEKATLQAALEKLAASWRENCGAEDFDSFHKGGKHHKHKNHEA